MTDAAAARHEPWYRPVPLVGSATTVVVIAVLLTVESLWVFSLIEGPDFDLGDSTTKAFGESFQVHGIFTLVWLFLHPLLMRRGTGVSGRAALACVVWFTAALLWVAGAAYIGRHAAAAEGVHPFAWMGWSVVLLAALAPSVLIGAMIGERLVAIVQREVRRRLGARADDEGDLEPDTAEASAGHEAAGAEASTEDPPA